MRNQASKRKYLLELSKEDQKSTKRICYMNTSNFDKWKTFSEKSEPPVWWSIYKITQINWSSRLFAKFIVMKLTNLKTACHFKTKFFLWTKILENISLISVTAILQTLAQQFKGCRLVCSNKVLLNVLS